MMKNSAVNKAVEHFLKTTTLHGFKYLYSTYYVDRVAWLLCCCASACCAGVLCAVLWERFMEMPALLTLWDNVGSNKYMDEKMPAVVVCPPTLIIAEMFLDKLSLNKSEMNRLPITLERLFSGKSAAEDQLEVLNNLLIEKSLDLSDVIMKYTPNCREYTKRCRYQKFMVTCDHLFEKELTAWGLCCVMRPKKLKHFSNNLLAKFLTTETLELVLQCSAGDKLRGCQFLTIYESEENVSPNLVIPGYYYMAHLRFTAVPETSSAEDLVETSCVADREYSKTFCMLRCAEKQCGCRDPLHPEEDDSKRTLPVCSVTQISCLRNRKNITCNCLPSCKIITTDLNLEASKMNFIEHTIDPFFAGLNVTPSIVINLRVNVGHSRIFVLNPVDTWLTLLSSLGGVFNMFLGVGLFSVLEILYFILVKLPMAIKKSSEINPLIVHTTRRPVIRY